MTTDGPGLKFSVPISKVDKQKRLVSGFATLDNPDEHDDVVSADASNKAFARFRGNLREMHAPVAVGKVVDFEERVYYDPDADEFYNGIYVTSYVSTGAEDTWQKVLDGTLTGFSIGGKAIEVEEAVSKSGDKHVRIIKDYELLELSLVDNPANQLANIFAIQKSKDGPDMIKGMALDVRTENVLYCETDQHVTMSKQESATCADCGEPMKNIGWVESDSSEKKEVVKSLLAKYKTTAPDHKNHVHVNINGAEIMPELIAKAVNDALMKGETNGEGGTENMTTKPAEEAVVETAEVDETVAVDETAAPEEEVKTEVAAEKETPAETPVEQPDVAKLFTDFAAELKKTLETSQTETQASINTVKTEVNDVVKGLETKISDLATKVGELEAKDAEVEKRVDSLDDATALRKSAEVGGTQPAVKKDPASFRGVFLNVNDD